MRWAFEHPKEALKCLLGHPKGQHGMFKHPLQYSNVSMDVETLENLSYFSLYSSYFKDIYIYVKLMLEWFSKAKPYIFGINT